MRYTALAFLLVACDGSASGTGPPWTGNWQSTPSVPGAFVTMSLSGTGQSITGSGVRHREAGVDLSFTVAGLGPPTDPGAPFLMFRYADGTNEVFDYGQPDANHISLRSRPPGQALEFARQ